MPIPFVTVDAFTSVKYRGNPAAVVMLPLPLCADDAAKDGVVGGGKDGFPLDDFLIDVAKEMNLSETAFVKPREGALDADGADGGGDGGDGAFEEYDLRWFTPSGAEVDLCGHATLATAHALWSTGGVPPTRPLRFHTRSGALPVLPLGGGLAELDFPSAPPIPVSLVPGPDPRGSKGEDAIAAAASVTPETVAAALNLPESTVGACRCYPANDPRFARYGYGLTRVARVVSSSACTFVFHFLTTVALAVFARLLKHLYPRSTFVFGISVEMMCDEERSSHGAGPSSSAPKIVGRNAFGDTFAVFSDPRHVLRASPSMEAVAALGGRGLVATAAGGLGQGGVAVDFTSRFWGPNIGIPEDPVTGSSFCGLAPYWSEALGVAPGAELVGYQASTRGGMVRVAVRDAGEKMELEKKSSSSQGGGGGGGERSKRVSIRGYAVTVFRGEIL